jgi:hypothetical protein
MNEHESSLGRAYERHLNKELDDHLMENDSFAEGNMCCEYSTECAFAEEQSCKYEGNHQDCALWRDFSVKEKTRDIECHYIRTKVQLPDMDLYKDDALLCDAINKMRR